MTSFEHQLPETAVTRDGSVKSLKLADYGIFSERVLKLKIAPDRQAPASIAETTVVQSKATGDQSKDSTGTESKSSGTNFGPKLPLSKAKGRGRGRGKKGRG